MQNEILLTSEQFVKSTTSISDNVAGKFLLPSIREAQEVGLRRIIGDGLLAELKARMDAGLLDGLYLEAVERSQYYLAYQSVVELLGKVNYKICNFGVAKSNDENLQAVGPEELGQTSYYWQSKADSAALDLQNWLLDNRAGLPELSDCDCHRIHACLYSAASCGIFLGGAHGKGPANLKRCRK